MRLDNNMRWNWQPGPDHRPRGERELPVTAESVIEALNLPAQDSDLGCQPIF